MIEGTTWQDIPIDALMDAMRALAHRDTIMIAINRNLHDDIWIFPPFPSPDTGGAIPSFYGVVIDNSYTMHEFLSFNEAYQFALKHHITRTA